MFPAAVREAFTYSVPEELHSQIKSGIRVWVPFQKHKAIGMVVNVHDREPEFDTRTVENLLDEEPVLSDELLRLTQWIHRFYYCGWGEVIQAGLPAGLNFYSEKYLKVTSDTKPENEKEAARNIYETVKEKGTYLYSEAEKRWSESEQAGALQRLIKAGFLEIWEEPSLKIEPRSEKLWRWAEGASEESAKELVRTYSESGKRYKWIQALDLLLDLGLPELHKKLTNFDLLDSYTLNRIADEGLTEREQVESFDLGLRYEHDPLQLTELNDEQQQAYESIRKPLEQNEYASFLLYGITGSGKTEVYIHALKRALEQGKGGLVLVPEIGLTPQIIRRFYKIFGDQIAVLHSRLTNRERYDAWRALYKGEKRIAIGARSAVFAPVPNMGLIIVDEEHDSSYKQEDPAPRYHARDVAVMRATYTDSVIVMGSATPSMIALHGARKGKSELLSIGKRPLEARLPQVNVLDLKQYRSAMRGPLAVPLYNAIKQALEKDEQAILLYNRRGYASFVQCEKCGQIPECPNCSVSLTFHKSKNQLRCHYCGYTSRAAGACGECGGELETIGSGTQQLEEEIENLFQEAGVLRMDFDTTSGKDAHERILGKFGRKEADILVGTQIVGKGLDFPDVTVVGVIQADTELAFPSFRSGERLFQLLCQVAGRSGRASKEGVVYFQTWQPEHPAIEAARGHSYRSFAKRELAYRKNLKYPPFSRIIRFIFKGKQEPLVKQVAETFTRAVVDTDRKKAVLGPSPATITKMQKYFRWETLVKISPSWGAETIEQFIDRIMELYDNIKPSRSSNVRINIDVDVME